MAGQTGARVMAYKDDEIKRFRKKEQARGRKRSPPDPDTIAERPTREKIVEELLKLETEAEFLREFERVMKSYGLRVGPQILERARTIWKTRH